MSSANRSTSTSSARTEPGIDCCGTRSPGVRSARSWQATTNSSAMCVPTCTAFGRSSASTAIGQVRDHLRRADLAHRCRRPSVPGGRTRPPVLHRREAARSRGPGPGRFDQCPRSAGPRLHGGPLATPILGPGDEGRRVRLRRRSSARAGRRTPTFRRSEPAAALRRGARHCGYAHAGARAACSEEPPEGAMTGRPQSPRQLHAPLPKIRDLELVVVHVGAGAPPHTVGRGWCASWASVCLESQVYCPSRFLYG